MINGFVGEFRLFKQIAFSHQCRLKDGIKNSSRWYFTCHHSAKRQFFKHTWIRIPFGGDNFFQKQQFLGFKICWRCGAKLFLNSASLAAKALALGTHFLNHFERSSARSLLDITRFFSTASCKTSGNREPKARGCPFETAWETKLQQSQGTPQISFATGLSELLPPELLPPLDLIWQTRSNWDSAGTSWMELLKPCGTLQGCFNRAITAHGGVLTRWMGPTMLIVCLYSLTSGGVFEALGCLPATALMAAKLGLVCNSSQ